jgi:hypothetical protein
MTVSRYAFYRALEQDAGDKLIGARVHILYRGIPPFDWYIIIRFNSDGLVSKIQRPYLLD